MKRPKNRPNFSAKDMLELWLKVEENFHNHFIYGICGVLCAMKEEGIITKCQRDACFHDICDYSERRWGDRDLPESYSLWKMGEKKPRLALIQKMIMKYLKVQEHNPRSTWEKVRDYLPSLFNRGLCVAIIAMHDLRILNDWEVRMVFAEVKAERERLGGGVSGIYIWEPGIIELRLMFINKQLGNRPLYELWKLVADNFDAYFMSTRPDNWKIKGLCSIIGALNTDGKMNTKEYSDIMHDLETDGERMGKRLRFFYWPKGDAVARKKYINLKLLYHGAYAGKPTNQDRGLGSR